MASSMTEIDVVNRALSKLGAMSITSLNEKSNGKLLKSARVMAGIVSPVRDRFLRENPWNPAVTRVTIAKDTTAPSWGFSARFSLPSDFLKMLNVESSGRVFQTTSITLRTPPQNLAYRIEGEYILAEEETSLNVRYVRRLTDMSQYTSDMVEALATLFAFEACYDITGDIHLKEQLKGEYREQIQCAKRNDGWDDDYYIYPLDEWDIGRL